MARKCACERLLDLVEHQPQFMRAGLAGAMVFIKLVRMMTRFGDGSSLRLGFVFGSWKEVADWARIPETELETQLQNLKLCGIVDFDGASVSISETLVPRDRRAEAARINGGKGGRPRKNGPAPHQREFLYPYEGGLSEASAHSAETKIETQHETQAGAAAESGSTTSFSERESSSESNRTDPPWVLLGRELAAILHLDPNGKYRFDIVKGWLEAGATSAWLAEVFREVMARKSPPPHPSFSYLDKVIRPRLRANVASSLAPEVASPMTVEQRNRAAEWDAIYGRWQKEGFHGVQIPKRKDWIFGEVGDRSRWLLYPTMGPAAFRQAA